MIQEEFHHVRAYFINGGTTLTSEEEDGIEALLAIGFFSRPFFWNIRYYVDKTDVVKQKVRFRPENLS